MLLSIIAAYEIEPFFTFFKIPSPSGFWLNPAGFLTLLFCLSLLLAAVVTMIRPLFQKEADGKHRFYLINFIFSAIIMVTSSFSLVPGFGKYIRRKRSDMCRCLERRG